MALPGMFEQLPAEWPGAAPGKFTDKLTAKPLSRKIVACNTRNGDGGSLARQGFVRYFTDPEGLMPLESKRMVGQKPGEPIAWRPCKRSLSEPGAQHWEKPEGLKQVEPANTKVVPVREKRHLRQVSSKEEYYDRQVGPRTTTRENGLRAADQPAHEVDISLEFQRKARLDALPAKRNGIACRTPGDKNYKHPDYDRGFHHAGGLAVGAGFHRGNFKKSQARNDISVWVESDVPRHVKTYAEKMRERKPLECYDVEALTEQWEGRELKTSSDTNAAFVEAFDADEQAEFVEKEKLVDRPHLVFCEAKTILDEEKRKAEEEAAAAAPVKGKK
jgi:hypothetical protein